MNYISVLFLVLVLAGCASPDTPAAYTIALTPQTPDDARKMMWSPKGEQLHLQPDGDGLVTMLRLGPEGAPPIALRLTRSPGQPYYDRLFVDRNHDGQFGEEPLVIEADTVRNRIWSSFDAVLEVPAVDPATGGPTTNPYPLSFWYVEDPRAPEPEPVLRFSRRGWMQGRGLVGGQEALVLLVESTMDGVFDEQDYWGLALPDSASELRTFSYARAGDRHAWLGEQAFRLIEVHPSGREVVIEPFDPGITRQEEVEMEDHLAVDRQAPRSGRSVAFSHDFAEAERRAQAEGKRLLVDFETTWCMPCKTMDEWVYTADAVVEAASGLVAVKVDGDEQLDLVKRFDVAGYPTMILVEPDGAVVRRAMGYQSVEAMTAFLAP